MNHPGDRPQFLWIKISDLFVDTTYQRTTEARRSRKNIDYLVQNFTFQECGVLIVARPPGSDKYSVIDGQHRVVAACKRGDIPELPCFVIENYSTKQQAKSFVSINQHRVELNFLTKFHASVAAGNEKDIAVYNFLKSCNVTIPIFQQTKLTQPRELVCLAAIRSLMAQPNILKWTLETIIEAYGEQEGKLRAELIKALHGFKKAEPGINTQVVIKVLRDLNLQSFITDAILVNKTTGQPTVKTLISSLARKYKIKSSLVVEEKKILEIPVKKLETGIPATEQNQQVNESVTGCHELENARNNPQVTHPVHKVTVPERKVSPLREEKTKPESLYEKVRRLKKEGKTLGQVQIFINPKTQAERAEISRIYGAR